MTNGNEDRNPVGALIEKALDACFGNVVDDNVRGLLNGGDFRGAAAALKEVVSVRGPVGGLEKAVQERFPGVDTSLVRSAMESAQYGVVVDSIIGLSEKYSGGQDNSASNNTGDQCSPITPNRVFNPYEGNPLAVALKLCGSILKYNGNEALITKVSGWSAVGGDDQRFPIAEPGTIGTWHSNAYGGYDVGIVSAHEADGTGIVAFYGLKPIVDGKVRAELKSKNKIANEWGFTDSGVYGRNLVTSTGLPMEIEFRQGGQINVGGKIFKIEMEGTERERTAKSGDMMLGTYKLVKG